MFTDFMEVLHLALAELIKCRGGIGPWFDEFQAQVMHELKNPLTEGVGMPDEIQATEIAIRMTNAVFDGIKSDFDCESSGWRHR